MEEHSNWRDVNVPGDLLKKVGADGLKEVLALGPLAVTVTVFLTVVVPAEGARKELVTEGRIWTPLCSIFPVEEFVEDDFCYPRLLSV